MCRTWTITYLCNHTCPFRLSTCLGQSTLPPAASDRSSVTAAATTTTTTTPPARPSCSSVVSLSFTSPSLCGPCAHEDAAQALKDDWTHRRARLAVRAAAQRRRSLEAQHRAGLTVSGPPTSPPDAADEEQLRAAEEMRAAEEEFAQRLWAMGREFPSAGAGWKVLGRVVKVAKRGGSLLKVEVRPEDVVETVDEDGVEEDEGEVDSAVEIEDDIKGAVERGEVDGEDRGDGVGGDVEPQASDHEATTKAPPLPAKHTPGVSYKPKATTTTLTIKSLQPQRDGKTAISSTAALDTVLENYRLPTLVELMI